MLSSPLHERCATPCLWSNNTFPLNLNGMSGTKSRYMRWCSAQVNSLSAPGKPLQKERWAGVVDAAGSSTLANALAQTRYGGVVTACGLAQGLDLPSSVMPFILRGVTLVGIDSVMAPMARRALAWQRLAHDLAAAVLEQMVEEITLDQVIAKAHDLMAGAVRGRIVVRLPPCA